jgi:hypothetical protein
MGAYFNSIEFIGLARVTLEIFNCKVSLVGAGGVATIWTIGFGGRSTRLIQDEGVIIEVMNGVASVFGDLKALEDCIA